MPSFPLLSTGAIAQFKSRKQVQQRVQVLSFLDGGSQRFRQMLQPSRQWVIRYETLTADERASIEEFFRSQQGQQGTFSFTDPWTGTEYASCAFGEDTAESVLRSRTDCNISIVIEEVQE